MTTRHHRRVSGTVRRLPSGRWQSRYTGPDGAQRAVGVFPTKAEADQALAFEISEIARGTWCGPRRGDQPLGDFLRTWIATRADLAPSTRAPYERMFAQWIDADVPLGDLSRSVSRQSVRLGVRTLASIGPADIREWDAAVLAEARRRAGARWTKASVTPERVNKAIRAWAAEQGRPVAPTGRMSVSLREAWLSATGGEVPLDPRAERHGLGHTEAAQAFRLLHTGMAQAVFDGLKLTNPCAVKGASQRDSRHRTEPTETVRETGSGSVWCITGHSTEPPGSRPRSSPRAVGLRGRAPRSGSARLRAPHPPASPEKRRAPACHDRQRGGELDSAPHRPPTIRPAPPPVQGASHVAARWPTATLDSDLLQPLVARYG